jgi:hypothetical protein
MPLLSAFKATVTVLEMPGPLFPVGTVVAHDVVELTCTVSLFPVLVVAVVVIVAAAIAVVALAGTELFMASLNRDFISSLSVISIGFLPSYTSNQNHDMG